MTHPTYDKSDPKAGQPTKVVPAFDPILKYSKEFEAVWAAIKRWDLQRTDGAGYAAANGDDVRTILNALGLSDTAKE
jgi:hypothetical protein